MEKDYDGVEPEPAIAIRHWEAKWFAAGSALNPSYVRATAALRCWVDGMEAALENANPEALGMPATKGASSRTQPKLVRLDVRESLPKAR
jgi:hypothetical protein